METLEAWRRIAKALSASIDPADRTLAAAIARFTEDWVASSRCGQLFVWSTVVRLCMSLAGEARLPTLQSFGPSRNRDELQRI
jgi:hypothetical protein